MKLERALLVDDNAANLRLARFVLEHRGCAVQTAEDGQAMWARLEDFTPQVILMDIQLPGTDGLELTRQLKADPRTRGIAVVALTAYAMKGDEARVLAAGCDGYIAKPIDTRRLVEQVEAMLRDR